MWLMPIAINLLHIQGGPKNQTSLSVENLATVNGRKVCNMSNVSECYIEQEIWANAHKMRESL